MCADDICAVLALFEDDTAYETYALTALADADEMVRGRTLVARDDIRGRNTSMVRYVADSLGAADARAAVQKFRPLVFASAYKVLDLVIEMVARLNVPERRGRWSFAEKVAFVQGPTPATLPHPLDAAPDFWPRYTALYVALEEGRHAVIHRRVKMERDGDLQMYDPEGRPVLTVTAAQTASFALAVWVLREAVVRADGRARRLNSFAQHLDGLTGLHGFPEIGVKDRADDLRIIEDDLESLGGSRWRINAKRIADHMEKQESPPFADVVWQAGEHPGWRFYGARFEEMPVEDEIEFDERDLPSWLRRLPPEQAVRPELLTMLRWNDDART